EVTAVTTEKGQTSDERVGHDLECQRGKRFFRVWLAGDVFPRVRIGTVHIRKVQRRGQVTANGIQRRLHTLILERGTAHHRHDAQIDRSLADSLVHLCFGDAVGVLEELFHQMVIVLGNSLYQLSPPFKHVRHHIVGDRDLVEGHTLRFHMPDDTLHFDQVDHALEVVFGAYRQLQRNGLRAQHFPHLVDDHQEVGARTVHLVHETDPRYPVT